MQSYFVFLRYVSNCTRPEAWTGELTLCFATHFLVEKNMSPLCCFRVFVMNRDIDFAASEWYRELCSTERVFVLFYA